MQEDTIIIEKPIQELPPITLFLGNHTPNWTYGRESAEQNRWYICEIEELHQGKYRWQETRYYMPVAVNHLINSEVKRIRENMQAELKKTFLKLMRLMGVNTP